MNTPVRLGAFIVGAAALFGLALLIGNVAGPVGTAGAAAEKGHGMNMPTHESHAMAGHLPGGLQVSQDGYTLHLGATTAHAGSAQPLTFKITGPDGQPVAAYEKTHEKDLHLIAVRRDFTGFQHVHPTLTGDTWSTRLDLAPGVWRVFADFRPRGTDGLTLGADVTVPGAVPAPPPSHEVRTSTVDGYTVTLSGDLIGGADAMLTATVTKDGRPVSDLQPYLGAYGHLVALREGDLAYLHVHPEEGGPAGPEIAFHASVPSAGTYHLFLDFQHRGVVRTAEFTLPANAGSAHSH